MKLKKLTEDLLTDDLLLIYDENKLTTQNTRLMINSFQI